MRLPHVLLAVLAVSAHDVFFFSHDIRKDVSPYRLGVDIGIDTATDPPVRGPPPPLPKRPVEPASDDLWTKCSDKGCTLSSAMQGNDAAAGSTYNPKRDTARSSFRSIDDLQRWGWSEFPSERIAASFYDFYRTWGIGEALEGLGISQYSDEYEGGEHRFLAIDYRQYGPLAGDVDKQSYDVDGKIFRATGASYTFTIDVKDGVIMGLNRVSPRYAAKDRKPPVPSDQWPAVRQFSDVAWIGWDSMTEGDEIRGLRYFLSVGIINIETKEVVRRALKAKGWELSLWPGHMFERHWPET